MWLLRLFLGAGALLIAGAMYLLASATVDWKECNITAVETQWITTARDKRPCTVAFATTAAMDRPQPLLPWPSARDACLDNGTLPAASARCYEQRARLYLERSPAHIGVLAVLAVVELAWVIGSCVVCCGCCKQPTTASRPSSG